MTAGSFCPNSHNRTLDIAIGALVFFGGVSVLVNQPFFTTDTKGFKKSTKQPRILPTRRKAI